MYIVDLLQKTNLCKRTCTTDNPKNDSLVLATTQQHFLKVITSNKKLYTLVPKIGVSVPKSKDICDRVNPIIVDNPKELFILYHNYINENKTPLKKVIENNCEVHSSAVIGTSGMRYVRVYNDIPVKMKHMGTVYLGDFVEVGACTVIHRGTIDDTIIKSHVKIGSNCSIGHNCIIGENTMITSGVNIAGSVWIGKYCWIGVGTAIRDNVRITDGVRLGHGSVVTKDLMEPGTYFGNPAVRRGDYDGSL